MINMGVIFKRRLYKANVLFLSFNHVAAGQYAICYCFLDMFFVSVSLVSKVHSVINFILETMLKE